MNMRVAVASLVVVAVGAFAAYRLVKQSSEPKVLHLACWSGYSVPALLQQFEKETGYKVVEEHYTNNEELQSKMEAGKGAGNYDVVCPTDYTIPQFVQKGLLAKLDHERIPNLKFMGKLFTDKGFDKGNTYSVPFLWGTTGIGYNKRLVTEAPTSWDILFDEAKAAPYAGRMSMLDQSREAIAAALKYLGHSANSTSPELITQAKELLIKQKKWLGRYDISAAADLVAAGELAVAHYYSGDVLRAAAKNPDVAYVFPKEGGFIWMDNLAIAAQSKHKDIAQRYLDFVMRPDVAAEFVKATGFPSANEEARKLLPADIANNPSRYPSEEALQKAEWIEPVSNDVIDLMEKAWKEVKDAPSGMPAAAPATEASPVATATPTVVP